MHMHAYAYANAANDVRNQEAAAAAAEEQNKHWLSLKTQTNKTIQPVSQPMDTKRNGRFFRFIQFLVLVDRELLQFFLCVWSGERIRRKHFENCVNYTRHEIFEFREKVVSELIQLASTKPIVLQLSEIT